MGSKSGPLPNYNACIYEVGKEGFSRDLCGFGWQGSLCFC